MLKTFHFNNQPLVMGHMWQLGCWGGSWRGGSQEVIRPIAIVGLKMEDVCILYNVIEILWWRKVTKIEKGGPFGLFKLQITLAQLCNNQHVCVNIQIFQLLKARIDRWDVGHNSSFLWLELHRRQQIFELCKIREVDLHALGHLWQLWLGCEFHFWWT
jgi:hypothetical protein